jgi:hypothetical protein
VYSLSGFQNVSIRKGNGSACQLQVGHLGLSLVTGASNEPSIGLIVKQVSLKYTSL